MARTEDHHLTSLAEAVAAAEALLPHLRSLLREPSGSGPRTGTMGRSAPAASEPWNSAAAGAYWDIWYGARTLAARLRASLGLSDDCSPGPEGFAQVLACAPSAPDKLVGWAAGRIWSWVQRANALPDIGESEPWVHVPQVAGAQPPACPYCHTFGLRMQHTAGQVRCFFPDCRDLDGNPTRARMQQGQFGAALVFGDGTTLAFV